jgi:AcrR family transcriptional regulator
MPRKKSDPRLSQQDWLENALTVLSKKGRAGLSIKDLSAALGVSRGSFYWHFKDRNHFVHALLEYWYEEYSAGAPAAIGRDSGSAEERLMRLMRLVHDHELTRHDLTMRTLAIRDPQFSRSVRKADRFRLDFIKSLFVEMGFTDNDVKVRARACLAYMTMEHDIFDQLDRKHRSDLVDHLHGFLVKK